MILNLLSTALISVFMVINNLQFSAYVDTLSNAYRIMLNNDYTLTLTGATPLFSYNEVQSCLSTATAHYFDHRHTSLFPVQLNNTVVLTMRYQNGSSILHQLTEYKPLGPFVHPANETQWMLFGLINMAVVYPINTTQPAYVGSGHYSPLQYSWQLNAVYDFSAGGGAVSYTVSTSGASAGLGDGCDAAQRGCW